jgi:hypothetical protein
MSLESTTKTNKTSPRALSCRARHEAVRSSFADRRFVRVVGANPSSPLKTFTAPDGAFTFRYPSKLVSCEPKKDEGRYS